MKFITTIIQHILQTRSDNVLPWLLEMRTRCVLSFSQKFIKEDKKILGRWNTDYCDTKTNRKIDLSNEDHCGPCGEYILDKKHSVERNNLKV
jgi:hypothetical protein